MNLQSSAKIISSASVQEAPWYSGIFLVFRSAAACLFAFALPAICAAQSLRRASKESEWQDKLWQAHQAEEDPGKRKMLREEMRDLSRIHSGAVSQASRQAVTAALIWTMLAIAVWLIVDGEFSAKLITSWVLSCFMFLSFLGAMILIMRRFDD